MIEIVSLKMTDTAVRLLKTLCYDEVINLEKGIKKAQKEGKINVENHLIDLRDFTKRTYNILEQELLLQVRP